jgi:hypothetical protein
MAKKKHQQRSFNAPQRPPAATNVVHSPVTPATSSTGRSLNEMVQAIHAAHDEVFTDASEEERQEVRETVAAFPAGLPSADELMQALKQAREVQEQCQRRSRTLESKTEEAVTKSNAAVARGEELRQERQNLERERALFMLDRRALETDREQMIEREEQLLVREADAEAGFLQRREGALQQLRDEMIRLTSETTRVQDEQLKQRQRLEQELRDLREQHAAQLHGREEQFEQQVNEARGALALEIRQHQADKLKLSRRLEDMELDQQDLQDERLHLQERARRDVASQLEHLEGNLRAVEQRLQSAREDRDQLSRQLDERQEALRQFAGRSPEEVLRELLTVRTERDGLRAQLENRPSNDALQRLRLLEDEREDWATERLQAVQRAQALEQRLNRASVAVTELETLRDHKVSLEAQATLLRTALHELRADVDKHITSSEGKMIFPACSDLDSQEQLQERPVLHQGAPDLYAFVQELQVRIASDVQHPLQYSISTLRTFVAGLAMSRLHLLQGISGTGKTSLPLAFTRATGGLSALTEVQSGWRDRADLLGNFNAFERRFYESEFLQTLYRASLPRYQDVPVMLVLDEMNLSHPEQYFASILSVLENPEQKQLMLMEAPVSPAPALLRGGRILDLPENVWFIGTANHDETTKDFADKTYDRAHVMELPRHFETVERRRSGERPPLSYTALMDAFAEAKSEFADDAERAYGYLDRTLGAVLQERFNLNWGNRLERQMRDFVPVMVAAGGTVSDATDHILTTKILRKLQGQFDVDQKDIRELQRQLKVTWSALGAGSPTQSNRLLDDILRKMGVNVSSV